MLRVWPPAPLVLAVIAAIASIVGMRSLAVAGDASPPRALCTERRDVAGTFPALAPVAAAIVGRPTEPETLRVNGVTMRYRLFASHADLRSLVGPESPLVAACFERIPGSDALLRRQRGAWHETIALAADRHGTRGLHIAIDLRERVRAPVRVLHVPGVHVIRTLEAEATSIATSTSESTSAFASTSRSQARRGTAVHVIGETRLPPRLALDRVEGAARDAGWTPLGAAETEGGALWFVRGDSLLAVSARNRGDRSIVVMAQLRSGSLRPYSGSNRLAGAAP